MQYDMCLPITLGTQVTICQHDTIGCAGALHSAQKYWQGMRCREQHMAAPMTPAVSVSAVNMCPHICLCLQATVLHHPGSHHSACGYFLG